MEVYKIPIEFAFIVFPFIAFILTIPFLIHQYRKYGAIPILKSAIFYSMILYLICAYFLVMLPLPSIEVVSKMTGPKVQLTLFKFVIDIVNSVNFDINSIDSFLAIFKSSSVYTVLFNIILTLPFGVYLRYFFKKKWYHSLIYSFLLSLFFELTQLSGLYGLYPRPYRLFDVDDLLINSLGGLFGHIITPVFTRFLPTKEELEIKSYEKGKKVTLLRRIMSLVIDCFFLLIFCLISKILFYGTLLEDYYSLITFFIYYIIFPTFFSGKTIGKLVIKLKITGHDQPARWYQILIRNIMFVYIFMYPFIWIKILSENVPEDIIERLCGVIIIFQIINILCYIATLPTKEPLFLYEKISRTKNVSTIENEHFQLIDFPKVKAEKHKTNFDKNLNDCKNK